jgi:N-acetylneuraminic acid mutarotase
MTIVFASSWLAAVILLAGACTQANVAEKSPHTKARVSPSDAGGFWNELPKAPVGWYRPEGAFWIEGKLIVVAGSVIERWDPRSREWHELVDIPQSEECEGCGYSEVAVWSGEEILLWGGGFSYLSPTGPSMGAAYNPKTNELRVFPAAPMEPRWWHSAVWSGEEMIVWGGACGRHECTDGAAYDPASDSWRVIAEAPVVGYGHSTVWTGEEMLVWGGSDDHEAEAFKGFPRSFLGTGAAYDPAADSWRELAKASLDPRGWHSAVWTGKEMIVWGGVRAPCDAYPCEDLAADAGAYDPGTDSWREIDFGPLSGRVDHTAVWTGSEMIVWGGSSPGGAPGYADGASYNPHSDDWTTLPDPSIAGRFRHQAIWADGTMVIWGGQGEESFADGAVFYPSS